MLRKLRPRSIYDVFAALALVVALGGTGAYAANEWNGSNIQDETLTGADIKNSSLTGADVFDNTLGGADVTNNGITGSDLAPNAVISSRILDGQVSTADIGNGAVNGTKVAFNSLTGSDIDESTLVGGKDGDFCGNSGAAFFSNARLCAGSDGVTRTIFAAVDFCASLPGGLRLPTFGEAELLAIKHDVPGVGTGDFFWTDEISSWSSSSLDSLFAIAVNENGTADNTHPVSGPDVHKTVCVTTPD